MGLSVTLYSDRPLQLHCGGETVLIKYSKRTSNRTIVLDVEASKDVTIAGPHVFRKLDELQKEVDLLKSENKKLKEVYLGKVSEENNS